VSTENNLRIVTESLNTAKGYLSDMEQKEVALKADIDHVTRGAMPVESTTEYYQLNAKYRDIQDEIRKLEADSSLEVAAMQKEIDSIADGIKSLEQAAARMEARKNGLKRIEELKADERRLASEFEELERQLYLTEEFIRAKVQMLEGKINSKFRMARFKLFEVQVNGALAECCETTFNGVPYSNLNNGARIQIGLDIIRTLQAHYGFTCPVWIDNRESVVQIPEMDCQIISLIVSEKDKKLRIELIGLKEEVKRVG
jgi:hypothetical protein